MLATVVDISERMKPQYRQQFLIRELQHRSQIVLAVVQSIAAQSLADSKTLRDAREMLAGRIEALARAHRMLAKAAWAGTALLDHQQGTRTVR